MSKIYKISNDINDKVYIGKTESSLEKRFREHCNDAFRQCEERRPLYNAMKKYGIEHFTIELIEECSYENADSREQYWIEFYNTYYDGYNATLGGDGKLTIDRNELLSLWREGKSIRDIATLTSHDEGWVSKILQSLGVPKEKILEKAKKRVKEICSKTVLMLDKNTEEVLLCFDSTRDAARYLIETKSLNLCSEGGYSAHISEVCRGMRKTCLGYKWRYADL